MTWRLARSLETLRAQLRVKWPKRNTSSDGTIGDARHQARASDHNPREGVVCALDITEDFKSGPNLNALRDALLKDRRTKYVIYEGKLYKPGGIVQQNSGHDKHLHLSVLWDHKDEAQDWDLGNVAKAAHSMALATSSPSSPKRQVLKRGMTGGDVPVLQLRLRELGDYKGLVDGDFGPVTLASVKAIQARTGLEVDGVVGPLTWAKLAVAPSVAVEQTMNLPDAHKEPDMSDPKEAIKYYQSLGWSRIAAVVLVASLLWESGGNSLRPPRIKFEAHGDKDKGGEYRSHGAGQWNERAGRYDALLNFARERGKRWDDGETQLAFLDHELHTTERKAGALLRAAATLEEAMDAAILVWRPSIPHADRRLAIARTLV